MSLESSNYNDKNYQWIMRVVDPSNPNRIHIVPPEGPPVYRERLEAKIGGKAIDDVFLYRPDTSEIPRASDTATVKMGGLWTIGSHYTKEAIAMAQKGYDFATFIPNFNYPLHLPLISPKHRKSPYLRHAQNGRQVSLAVMEHTSTEQVRISGHSYGGLTVTEFIAEFPELIESVVLQDPAGLDINRINFAKLWSHELKPAGRYIADDLDNLPANTKENSIKRLTGNFPHALREGLGLVLPRSDMKQNLKKARELGVPVGLLLLGKSALFNAASVRAIAEKESLFDLIDEVDDYHVAPNIRPQAVVEKEIEMFDSLKFLRKIN